MSTRLLCSTPPCAASSPRSTAHQVLPAPARARLAALSYRVGVQMQALLAFAYQEDSMLSADFGVPATAMQWMRLPSIA